MSGHGWDGTRYVTTVSGFPSVAMTCDCDDFTAVSATDAGLRDAFADHLREVGVPQAEVFHAVQRARVAQQGPRVLPRREPQVDPVVAAADRILTCPAAAAVLWDRFELDLTGGAS